MSTEFAFKSTGTMGKDNNLPNQATINAMQMKITFSVEHPMSTESRTMMY